MGTQALGKWLIIAGGLIVLLGLAIYFGKSLSFLGRLPGDIRIERANFRLYIPITTCILLSLLLSAVAYLISRFR
jgi:uncharacterized protein HemY